MNEGEPPLGRHIVIHRPGGYRQLKCEQYPVPSPAPGEVLVRTSCVGVNYAESCIRWGLYESAKGMWPIVPGFEFSGVVVDVGDAVDDFNEGDEVFGVTHFNAYSTHVLVESRWLRKCTEYFPVNVAGANLVNFLTAYYAVKFMTNLRAGDSVLIHSASGGVGSSLVQLCRIIGCSTIIGCVGSSHKRELASSLGATAVLDSKSTASGGMWQMARSMCPQGFDAVFDASGDPYNVKQGYEHLRAGGKLVVYGFTTVFPKSYPNSTGALSLLDWVKASWRYFRTPSFPPHDMVSRNKSVGGFNLSFMFDRHADYVDAIDQLLIWAESGDLLPVPLKMFDLEEVEHACYYLESGQSIGRTGLRT